MIDKPFSENSKTIFKPHLPIMDRWVNLAEISLEEIFNPFALIAS